MEKYQITPGTAGLAQRISSEYEENGRIEKELYVLKSNPIMPCGKNQY